MPQTEVYDENFRRKYYGTAHRTGIMFFGSGKNEYATINGERINPGDTVTWEWRARYVPVITRQTVV